MREKTQQAKNSFLLCEDTWQPRLCYATKPGVKPGPSLLGEPRGTHGRVQLLLQGDALIPVSAEEPLVPTEQCQHPVPLAGPGTASVPASHGPAGRDGSALSLDRHQPCSCNLQNISHKVTAQLHPSLPWYFVMDLLQTILSVLNYCSLKCSKAQILPRGKCCCQLVFQCKFSKAWLGFWEKHLVFCLNKPPWNLTRCFHFRKLLIQEEIHTRY